MSVRRPSEPTSEFLIRHAIPADAALILSLIRELAAYEKLEHEVDATKEGIRQAIFDQGYAEVLLAFQGNEPAGLAVYFFAFSTFVAGPVLYLEDLFVRPAFRRRGLATAFFARLVRIAEERGCRRFEWSVLDWNRDAIDFYEKLGARGLREWVKFRLPVGPAR